MMDEKDIIEHGFFATAIRDFSGVSSRASVLDFGCGRGELVRFLLDAGFDAWGCDNGVWRSGDYQSDERLHQVVSSPYRLPFEDSTFDAVVSAAVLEHARNKEECFQEIFRVLKPGGVTLHVFPSKWFLPSEQHIHVPFANWMWPHVPYWWLALFARLGVRNENQIGLPWQEVARLNFEFCKTGLHYWSQRQHRHVVSQIFGNCEFPARYFLDHSSGGATRFARKLPMPQLAAFLISQYRMTMMVARKGG